MIPIAHPLADENTSKLILECTKKQLEDKVLISGVKDCQKEILKTEHLTVQNMVMIFSAETYPMDLITHIPILCEDRNIPYYFVKNTDYMNGFTCVLLKNEDNKYQEVSKIIGK